MQSKWHLAALGALLLGALTCIHNGSQQASAASITTRVPGIQSSFTRAHTHYYPPFNDGYIAGYNDCGNQLPPANPYWQGSEYLNGYNQGYSFCQSKRAEGAISGNTEGYQAGYQQCQQEHARPVLGSAPSFGDFAPPSEQSHDPAFSAAFAQGYNACQQQYGGH